MKFTALALLGTAFSTLGLAQDVAPQSDAFDMPVYQAPAADIEQLDDITPLKDVMSKNAEEGASYGETWADVQDTNRHILIMSSIDGFTAAGTSGPCFKGSNNSTIDKSLMDTGFGAKSPEELATTLESLPEASTDCKENARSYNTGLIQGMSDEHLSIYLTGAIAAYALKAECPADRHESAAMSAAAAILSASSDTAPANILRESFAEACVPSQL